jgi:hypothetical protein
MRNSRAANIYRRGTAAARRRIKARLNEGEVAGEGDGSGPILNGSDGFVPDDEVWPVRELFGTREPAAGLSYATVADYAESIDAMPHFMAASMPPLGPQRGWAIKALVSTVPEGAAILELAGSSPLAGGVLARLGYDVTVLDPFDGTASEPHTFTAVTRNYSALEFIRDQLPPTAPLPRTYAAVYSLGLLDRLEPARAAAVVRAGLDALDPGGVSLHCFAHVLAGWSADVADERLTEILGAAGVDGAAAALEPMASDPETYLVSAEAHNSWRGSVPYESYRMRRIGSLNLLTRPAGSGTL